MATVTLKDVRKSYGAVNIIQGVDLAIKDREFVVFVGPSGCGKSTLLRMIAGLEEITAGDLMIDGTVVNDVPPDARGLAMVFQSYALYPHMSVADNMAFALRLAGVPRAERDAKVASAAKILQLEKLLDRKPGQLSGGQRQRVAIGRAIVRQPKLFLFDEPLSNLDAALRMNTRLEIAALHRQLAATMVYVTHDQTEAMTLADRIVVLRAGRVEQVGTPMELYNRPANRFVAGFLGAPSMNFLPAEALGGPEGQSVGIRPEDLRLDPAGRMEGRVTHVENLGGDTVLVIEAEGQPVTARLFGQHSVAEGAAVRLAVPEDRLHRFDADGTALDRGPGGSARRTDDAP